MMHLDALELRLSNERMRLQSATTESERAIRRVFIAQIEKEIAGERKFLGIDDISTDELLAELED